MNLEARVALTNSLIPEHDAETLQRVASLLDYLSHTFSAEDIMVVALIRHLGDSVTKAATHRLIIEKSIRNGLNHGID